MHHPSPPVTDVTASHIIDDLTTALDTARRALADVTWSVGLALDAHRDGATGVVTEYLDRTLTAVAAARTATAGAGCVTT